MRSEPFEATRTEAETTTQKHEKGSERTSLTTRSATTIYQVLRAKLRDTIANGPRGAPESLRPLIPLSPLWGIRPSPNCQIAAMETSDHAGIHNIGMVGV